MVAAATTLLELRGICKQFGATCALDHVDLSKYTLLPNTAGAFSVEDALRISRLAREACGTDLIKLEVLGDKTTLLPDVHGTVKACEILVKEGFTVLPYTNDDPITARMLEDAGAAAIMPLASMIGSGHGVLDLTGIKLIRAQTRLPVVVDAGIGVPSDVCLSFEIGADAVLINTAIACAADPVMMATAMKKATKAGRLGYLAGRITKKEYGQVSSVGAGFGS